MSRFRCIPTHLHGLLRQALYSSQKKPEYPSTQEHSSSGLDVFLHTLLCWHGDEAQGSKYWHS